MSLLDVVALLGRVTVCNTNARGAGLLQAYIHYAMAKAALHI